MIPNLSSYVVPLLLAAGVGLWFYVDHLQVSRSEAIKASEQAAERVQQMEDLRALDEAALEGLRKSTAKSVIVTQEVIREVRVRIPADACPLPADWRVLHDAAAAGQLPPAPGRPDGAASGAGAAAR